MKRTVFPEICRIPKRYAVWRRYAPALPMLMFCEWYWLSHRIFGRWGWAHAQFHSANTVQVHPRYSLRLYSKNSPPDCFLRSCARRASESTLSHAKNPMLLHRIFGGWGWAHAQFHSANTVQVHALRNSPPDCSSRAARAGLPNPPSPTQKIRCFRIGFLVGEGGFEPPKSLTTDLQSAPFGRSGTLPYSIDGENGAGGRI